MKTWVFLVWLVAAALIAAEDSGQEQNTIEELMVDTLVSNPKFSFCFKFKAVGRKDRAALYT